MSDRRAMGADISHHQSRFVFQGNLDFIILRASFGTNRDDRFQQHLAAAAQVPVRGAYHYLLSGQPLEDQLQTFTSAVQGLGLHFLALDFEKKDNTLDRAFAQMALQGLDRLTGLVGQPVLLYTNLDNWNVGLQRFLSATEQDHLAAFELWVAQWPNVPNEAAARTTQSPIFAPGMRHWTFWQFSADLDSHPDRGAEFGVDTSKIDLDVFNGTREQLQQRFRADTAPIVVTPVDSVPQDTGPATATAVVAPVTTPGLTNQDMINAFFKAGALLGIAPADRFDLIIRAGLAGMADSDATRQLPYSGPSVEALPGLTDQERAALRSVLGQQPAPPIETEPAFMSWEHRAEPGLHGPADPGGGWVPEAFDVVRQSKVRAVKVLVPDVQPAEVAQLRQINRDMFLVARLFSGQLGERRPQGGDGTPEAAGRWFANEVADPGDSNSPMNRAIHSDISFFEVHNEPNLTTEGLGVNWQNGAEFARFFQAVVATLRPRYPGAQFGFPGLSPGPVSPPRLMGVKEFLQQASAAVALADFVCCHIYWGQEGVDLQAALDQLQEFCALFPGKRIICSEFSNNNPDLDRETKAEQYAQFYQACKTLPSNLGAMFAFALSWRDDKHREGFLELGSDGHFKMTPMAAKLGSHAV